MIDYTAIKKILEYPKDIVVVSHRNPDGDAIGSSMGIRRFLEKFGHNVKVIYPSDYPETFSFIRGIEQCEIYDSDPELCEKAVSQAEVIFCLDFNALDRIDKLGVAIENNMGIKIMIDHHLDPEPFSDYALSDTTASSTCELVYEFIQNLSEDKKLDREISESLFVGLITDTGSFKYATTPRTYEVASKLKAKGVDDYQLNDYIFNCMSHKQMTLLGHCLANRLEILPQHDTGIIHLTKEDYENFSIGRGDTEGIVNQILMIKGIRVAAFITEQPTIVKLSLRSKGDISVQDLARKYFKGGGHKNAAGGAAYAKLETVLDKFKSVIPEYITK